MVVSVSSGIEDGGQGIGEDLGEKPALQVIVSGIGEPITVGALQHLVVTAVLGVAGHRLGETV